MSDHVPGIDASPAAVPASGGAIQATKPTVTESAHAQGATVAAGLNALAKRKHKKSGTIAPAGPLEQGDPRPPTRVLPEGEMTLDQLKSTVIPDGETTLDGLKAKVSSESTDAFQIAEDDYGWHPGKMLKGESRYQVESESGAPSNIHHSESRKGASLAAKTLGVLARKGVV